MRLAAGVILGVIGVELMSEALITTPAWAMLAAFVCGGGFAVLVDEPTGFALFALVAIYRLTR